MAEKKKRSYNVRKIQLKIFRDQVSLPETKNEKETRKLAIAEDAAIYDTVKFYEERVSAIFAKLTDS